MNNIFEKAYFGKPYLNGECCYAFSPIISTKEDGGNNTS